jgi:hypothetical protein
MSLLLCLTQPLPASAAPHTRPRGLVLDGDHLAGDLEFTTADGQTGKAKLNLARVTE